MATTHSTQPSDPPSPSQSNSASPSSIASTEDLDPALLDEEENPLEDGLADNVAVSSKYSYADGGAGYNALKSHQGQLYAGMAVGGSHTWNYDSGTWKETKEEPDLWRIDYQTKKRRARNAPKGSGAPVGTEYHWLIVGHQHVRKIDANTYETHLTGSKYKLAHKSVTAKTWSIPKVQAQREREVELLQDAQRRIRGLPPVLSSEKVKVERKEKGQQSLDSLFKPVARPRKNTVASGKRKRS
ncbi:hypothetical protein N7532_002100 [Penicillium argentinense]|uniref:Uncharacterized protein n=1 Tax=Penicillium argentinense TaxID=1131581 RepID=A0A9W9G3Q1_9EURO|nr:uncharacterized protein N7532_002100 [Penicillium argentinense]KAJ5111565.1 hypothetical protein N7532_002100 [Penicillium argentinense]